MPKFRMHIIGGPSKGTSRIGLVLHCPPLEDTEAAEGTDELDLARLPFTYGETPLGTIAQLLGATLTIQ